MNRYRPYSNQRSRARGNQAAADQQRDTTQVVLKSSLVRSGGQTFTLLDPNYPDLDSSWADTGTIVINIYDVLLRSEFYQNYANMYDQVRIDNIRVDITPSIWSTSSDENPTPEYHIPKSLTVVTAWDRSGLSSSQFVQSSMNPRSYYCVIGEEIENYSSAVNKHLGPASIFNIKRYLYPQSVLEKNQFVNTKDLRPQFSQNANEPYSYDLSYGENFDKSLPNNFLEDSSVPFKPTLLVGVRSPYKPFKAPQIEYYGGQRQQIIGWNKLKPTVFTFEFEIVVTFRGLRYERIV